MELDVLGVTPKKKKQFESRGIYSVEDLLQYLPRAYRDYRSITGRFPFFWVLSYPASVGPETEDSS